MKWYVLYTRHSHERSVYDRLRQKGYEVYLPFVTVWRVVKGELRQATIPLFPRYVFVRVYLEMYAHLELFSISGVIRLVEDAEGQTVVVPKTEMRTLQQLSGSGIPLVQAPYPPEGEPVQVVQGALQGITGVLWQRTPTTLLVPIATLKMSVAVGIEAEAVQRIPVSI